MAEIICGIITGFLSLILYIYVSFTVRRKGPILTNDYLLATEEERKKLDLEAEYHLVSVVYACLATVFAFETVFIFTEWKWCLSIVFLLCGFVFVYAIIKGIKREL